MSTKPASVRMVRYWSKIDPTYFRPTEVDLLLGDPTKAREQLGWIPTVDFAGLVEMMVDADIAQVKSGVQPVDMV